MHSVNLAEHKQIKASALTYGSRKYQQNLEHTHGRADLRGLGLDLLKLAAPIAAQNFNVSEFLVGTRGCLKALQGRESLDLSKLRLSDEECVLLAQLIQHQVGVPVVVRRQF